jgi:hypothetical protein
MARLFWLSTAVLLAFAWGVGADEKQAAKDTAKAAVERLKKLEGTWVAAGKDGKATDQVISVFKVTAAGSAVTETIFPGQGHEMVTVYHLDGPDLVLTHYCALGNQPRMKLDPKSPKDELVFTFAGGSNIDPAKDMHMHEGSIKFLDDDRIEWKWGGYQDGKPADTHKVAMTLIRKK